MDRVALMHEAGPAVAPVRKRGGKRRPIVCLVSANPLALPELKRLAGRSAFRVTTGYIKIAAAADVYDSPVPFASVYVVDAFSTGPMTEAVVAGIRTRRPRACLMTIVDVLPEAQAFALLQLGVKGILRERDLRTQFRRAIAHVAGGGVWMPRGLMARFLDSTMGRSPSRLRTTSRRLSQRERQVFDRVVKSQSNKEIANELHISESTVKFHVARLFTKFGVRRRADLILQSVQDPGVLVH